MDPSSSPAAVSLESVTKTYRGVAAVSGLSLDVRPGEFLAILGPSGSGKTTTLRLIGGFEAPDSGSVRIAGEDVTFIPAERRKVNTIFQSYALFPHMSVRDNIAYGPRMRGVPRARRRETAERLLALVHLPDVGDRKPTELSGGMQQRVALARALANDPAVLLLDEPLGALDRKLREELQRELRRLQAELHSTFIYITHDQDEAFGMADRLAIMRDGRFEQIGDPAAVYDRPANAWVALFVGDANTVEVTVGADGALASDIGPIFAGYVAEGLRPGDRGIAIVRPEETRFETLTHEPPAQGNRFPARIVDVVTLGSTLRLHAIAGNASFESSAPRHARPPGPAFNVGDAVTVSFDRLSVRAYPRDARISA